MRECSAFIGVAAAWHAHRMLGARRVGAPPETYRKGELEGSPPSFTRDGRELTILIPDVDSKLRSDSVKHKSIKIVKKRSKRVHAIARACANAYSIVI